jgi:MFS family permease
MGWIGLVVTPDLAYAQLVAPLILAGAGVSMAMPGAQNAVLSSVTASEVGKASGTFNMLRYLGGVFGIAILVAVFAQAGNFGSAQAFSEGFALAIGIAAGLSLAGAAAGLGCRLGGSWSWRMQTPRLEVGNPRLRPRTRPLQPGRPERRTTSKERS